MIGYALIFFAVDYKRTKETRYGMLTDEGFTIVLLVIMGVLIIVNADKFI